MKNKMFRRITNRLIGRKKVRDEPMDYSAVQALLGKLDRATEINVKYSSLGDHMTVMYATRIDTAKFVEKEFRPTSDRYSEANHQVFSGEQDERHYVDLQEGRIKTSVGAQEFRKSPYAEATLDYILKTKK